MFIWLVSSFLFEEVHLYRGGRKKLKFGGLNSFPNKEIIFAKEA